MDFSPKADFAKGPSAAAWKDAASSRVFIEAAGAAMLDMQQRQLTAMGNEVAAANHYRMEGARTFLAILMNLTTPPPEPPKRPQSENLKHDI
jgi:hypothetical protein